MENELISTEKLEQLIVERKVKEIRNIFEVVPTIDIAEACDDFKFSDLLSIFMLFIHYLYLVKTPRTTNPAKR